MKKIFILIKGVAILFAILISFGCGGGGGDGGDVPPTTAPTISSLTAFKIVNGVPVETLSFDIGDMSNIEINASDPDLDMNTVYISQFLLPDLNSPYYPISEQILPSQSDPNMQYFFIDPIEIAGPAGNWRTCIWIVDKAGNESDEFCLHAVVNEDGDPGSPSLEVLPPSFDFGSVTDGQTVSPLEVTLRNVGTASLSVTDIQLSNTTNFSLDINGGTCASSAPTIAPGASCTVLVGFTPPSPPAFGTFSSDLTIRSNDPTYPVFDLSLLGTSEDINAISVKINQIEACPRPGLATVYVSVNDQGGFPVRTLDAADFAITEAGVSKTTTTAVPVDDTVTMSVALLLDYSGSITMEPDNVTDMENAAISFVNQLGANDEAEIIKFATTIEVTQAFTSNKASLVTAIQSTPNIGLYSRLYDAIVLATDNLSTRTKDRRAIIVITDGTDQDGSGSQLSTNGISDVIADANARGVPVFTVGLGMAADVMVLQMIADETGGTFFDSTTSDNLATIYQQLADLLFTDQYILTYTSSLADNVSGPLAVTATYAPGVSGSDTKTITVCP